MDFNCKGLLDVHIHSAYSFDGKEEISDIIVRAEQLGLSAICLTDLCEMNSNDLPVVEKNIIRSVGELQKLRENCGNGSLLLAGVELGQGTQNPEEAKRFLNAVSFDYVIGSLHNLAGEEDFYFLKYTAENALQYLERYFDELSALAEWGEFDALGHMTYPLRYMSQQLHEMPDMRLYREKTDAILQSLVKQNKALEINTSGLRTAYGTTYPGLEYVQRFKELGGKMVTLGSDAHAIRDIGSGIKAGALIAKKSGFDQLTYFVNRTPCFVSI